MLKGIHHTRWENFHAQERRCENSLNISKFQKSSETSQAIFKGTNAEYKYNEEVIGDKESLVLDCIYSIETVDAFEK